MRMHMRMRLRHRTRVQVFVVLVMKMEMIMHDLLVQVYMAVPLGEKQYYTRRHKRRPEQFGQCRPVAQDGY